MGLNMSIYRRLNPRLLVQAGLGLGLLKRANMSTSKKLRTLFRLYGSFYQNLFESLKSAHIIQLQERVRKAKPEFCCTSYRGFRNFYNGKEISSQNCSKCLQIQFVRLLFLFVVTVFICLNWLRQFAMKLLLLNYSPKGQSAIFNNK